MDADARRRRRGHHRPSPGAGNKKEPEEARSQDQNTGGDVITLNMVAATLKAANDIEVGFASRCKGWPVTSGRTNPPRLWAARGGGIGPARHFWSRVRRR